MYYQCHLISGNHHTYGWLKKPKLGMEIEVYDRTWKVVEIYKLMPQPRELLGWVLN